MVVTEIDDPVALELMSDRVRDAIARVRGRALPGLVPSASVAVVHWEDGDDVDAFMHNADRALHAEKLAFRERRSLSA